MDYRGCQVFILHPESGLRNRLVEFLRRAEFESFGLADSSPLPLEKLRNPVFFVSPEIPDSCAFADAVAGMKNDGRNLEVVWVGRAPQTGVKGPVIDGTDDEIAGRILDYLEMFHGRGARRFVRFGNQYSSIATFDFEFENRVYAGVIHDISAAGFSCTFRPEPGELDQLKVPNLRMRLPSRRIPLSGRFTSSRVAAGQFIHVFSFDERPPEDIVDVIYNFIYTSLAAKLSLH